MSLELLDAFIPAPICMLSGHGEAITMSIVVPRFRSLYLTKQYMASKRLKSIKLCGRNALRETLKYCLSDVWGNSSFVMHLEHIKPGFRSQGNFNLILLITVELALIWPKLLSLGNRMIMRAKIIMRSMPDASRIITSLLSLGRSPTSRTSRLSVMFLKVNSWSYIATSDILQSGLVLLQNPCIYLES